MTRDQDRQIVSALEAVLGSAIKLVETTQEGSGKVGSMCLVRCRSRLNDALVEIRRWAEHREGYADEYIEKRGG